MYLFSFLIFAQVVELVDTHDSGSCAARHGGSSPPLSTISMNFKDVEVVTFDVGGTLLFPHSSVGAIYSEVLAIHGAHVKPEGIDAAFQRVWKTIAVKPRQRVDEEGDREWWRHVVHHTLSEFDTPANFDLFFNDLWHTFMQPSRWKLCDDAVATLISLKERGYRLALLSNWDSRLRPLLNGIGLTPYFDAGIFISCELGMEKPDPLLFEWVENAVNCSSHEILHLGDSLVHDVEGARRAGWRTVHFQFREEGERVEDSFRIEALAQLLDILPGTAEG